MAKFFQDVADPTKFVDLDVSAVATGTIRTITMPDRSGTLFDASSTVNTASGNLTSTNVQAALVELQGDIDALNTLQGKDYIAGAVDPVVGDGVNGNYFLNVTTGDIFGPKAAGVWPGAALGNVYAFTTNMTGATGVANGTAGLVPAPLAGQQATFLRGDGTWQSVGGAPASATDTVQGIVELATPAEVVTGTDTARAVTPQGLAAAYTQTTDLASTAVSKGASIIGIQDAGALITATTVEGALAEIAGNQTGAFINKGTWDASAGTFPGGGAAKSAWAYRVSVAGIVDGVSFTVGDTIYAIANNASTTVFAANWAVMRSVSAVGGVVEVTSGGPIPGTSRLRAIINQTGSSAPVVTYTTPSLGNVTINVTGGLIMSAELYVIEGVQKSAGALNITFSGDGFTGTAQTRFSDRASIIQDPNSVGGGTYALSHGFTTGPNSAAAAWDRYRITGMIAANHLIRMTF